VRREMHMRMLTVSLRTGKPDVPNRRRSTTNDWLMRTCAASCALFIVLMGLSANGFGQQGQASISGNVEDNSGALLAGANITLINKDTGVVTKTTTYVSVGLLLVTFVLLWHQSRHVIPLARRMMACCLTAVLVGSFWFVRDASIYGLTDILGLARHNAVVVGQPQTLELFPSYFAALPHFMLSLFRSFWGQFGWMGVFLDARIYLALFAFSLFALLGLVPFFMRARWTPPQTRQLILLGAWIAFVLFGTMAYSLEFYQAQGRYLFPSLGAIAIFVAMGMRGWLSVAERLVARAGALRRVLAPALLASFVLASVALDLVCLYRFVVPQLAMR